MVDIIGTVIEWGIVGLVGLGLTLDLLSPFIPVHVTKKFEDWLTKAVCD